MIGQTWVRTDDYGGDDFVEIRKAVRLRVEPCVVSTSTTVWQVKATFIFEGTITIRSFDSHEDAQHFLLTILGDAT